jgi:hypothetical protein
MCHKQGEKIQKLVCEKNILHFKITNYMQSPDTLNYQMVL